MISARPCASSRSEDPVAGLAGVPVSRRWRLGSLRASRPACLPAPIGFMAVNREVYSQTGTDEDSPTILAAEPRADYCCRSLGA